MDKANGETHMVTMATVDNNNNSSRNGVTGINNKLSNGANSGVTRVSGKVMATIISSNSKDMVVVLVINKMNVSYLIIMYNSLKFYIT